MTAIQELCPCITGTVPHMELEFAVVHYVLITVIIIWTGTEVDVQQIAEPALVNRSSALRLTEPYIVTAHIRTYSCGTGIIIAHRLITLVYVHRVMIVEVPETMESKR